MKRALLLLTVIISFAASAQVKLEKIFVKFKEDRLDLSQPALFYRPSGYDPSKKYPLFIFSHGNGEGYGEDAAKDGRYLSRIYGSQNSGGPMYYIENTSWPDSFRVGGVGDYEKMFFLAIQAPSWSLNPQLTDVAIKYLLQTYPFIDKDRIYDAGLSAGGQTAVNWASRTMIEGNPFTEWTPLYNKVAAIIPMSPALNAYTTKAQRIVGDSIRMWSFGSDPADNYGTQAKALTQMMNDIKPGFARFTDYDGGHCCWGQFYTPSYKETINGQSMNIYEWALQFSRATPTTPVITIPTNQLSQTITLPTNSATINATYTLGSGTLSSKTWTKQSGPGSGYTIGSPNNENCTFTFTAPGTFVFRFTVVTSTATTYRDVTIVVNDPLPTATVNSPSITLPTTTVALTSTGTSNYTFTREWSPLKKVGQAPVSVLINGASTATGSGLGNPANSFVNKLASFWSQYNIGTVTNKSVGGNDIFDVNITADLNTGCKIWFGNFPSNGFTIADGYSITQICQQFQKIKDSCDARGVLFYITGTQPRGDFGNTDQARLKTINDSLKLRFPNNIIDIWTAVADANNRYKPEYIIETDPIHGNESMHSRLFELIVAKNITRSFATGAGTISSPSSANTNVTGLTASGTYYYQHAIVDQRGYAAYAVSTVTVNIASAVPPTVSAGSNQTIELPTAQVTLTGTATPAAGKTIASYFWELEMGVGPYEIVSPNSASTVVRSLTAGTYVFRLRATDNTGVVGQNTVHVTVNPNPSPSSDPYVKMFGTTEYGSYPMYYYPGQDSTKVLTYFFNDVSKKVEAAPINLSGKNAKYVAAGFAAHIGTGNFAYVLDEDGYLWRNRRIPTNQADRIDTDTTGAAFSGNEKVWVHMSTFITLKADGSLWYGGKDDYNLFAGNNAILQPIKFGMEDTVYTDVSVGRSILAITSSGTVHEWNQNGSLTPTVRTFPRPVVGIYSSYFDMKIALVPDATGSQTMGYPYVWGNAYQYWGGTQAYTTPTSIKSLWQLTQPIKKIKGIQNATYYIDSIGRLFAIGDNVQGELGNGSEWVNHAETNPKPYDWDWGTGRAFSGAPPQEIMPGSGIKWKDIFTSSNLQFYVWAIDSTNNPYFWGRDKSLVGWSGKQSNQEQLYPNAMDQLIPQLRNPIAATPVISVPFDIYTLTAGKDTTISTPSFTLNAIGTPSTGYSINSWNWTWNTNPNEAVIVNPAGQTTQITNLKPGTYTLTVQMTDNNTATISDDIKITVLAGSVNQPPVPQPGLSREISAQVAQIVLDGSQSTDDGFIKIYQWRQTGGPTCTITNPLAAQTSVTGMTTTGNYVFELSVTDNDDVVRTATVTISVIPVIGGPKPVIEVPNTGVNIYNRPKIKISVIVEQQ